MDSQCSPFVSVIIPAKNASKWLGLCLNAIVNQSYPKEHIEILVIDNGSTDNTIQIAQSYGTTVIEKPELKLGALRNCGTDIAKGTAFAFIDSDVVICQD